ncbi:class I SAM-dependent methyltransferase [Sphingobium sp. H39-3-25]|nr:class I SAM-dependent methyltransferase [Sphingobium arseniciresistens]
MPDHAPLTVLETYQLHGGAWAKLRGDRLAECSWLDRFCDLLPTGGAVLDIGCGSGLPIAGVLLRRGFKITGVDGTPAMLELFQRNLPGVEAHLIDMRKLALDRRFSGLLAWDSLFHLSPSDQRGMFARFQAHAEFGAPLMFTSGSSEGEAIGDLEGDPLYHASLDSEEYQSLLDKAGFAVLDHVVEDPSCGFRTVWLAKRRE